ncbi:MerR family transcriptional regulator [Massilia sp. YMA4]|uniref:MerR family transcriptional regulator n=1 Tax=Massilia sp. YMA4 TaxID=1593482 RepID=UPI000DD11BC9|nr:MerR family transcriptional regulator [Massilia sp. YMA4]AXA90063.1 MerR family transcriptional regulator [Massilia sp. YMA4]
MRIGAIAAATGISRDTLRFYEKRGLLRARRTANGYRDYPPEAVDWLRYIRTAQSLGFTLAEIEAELPLLAAPAESSAPVLRAALAAKLEEIDRRIDGLAALRGELARRLHALPAECPLAPGDQAASAPSSASAVRAVA